MRSGDVLRAKKRSSFRMAIALMRRRETYKMVPNMNIILSNDLQHIGVDKMGALGGGRSRRRVQ